MKWKSLAIVLAALLLAAVIAPTTQAQTGFEPTFEAADCAFTVPSGQTVDCGYLIVPEDHAHPENGSTIRLHVAIYRTISAAPAPDPIVYLEGGPGGSGVMQMAQNYNYAFSSFGTNRDFIVFDQRGTGYSEPSLGCPESTELLFSVLDQNLSSRNDLAMQTEAVRSCLERLTDEGVNLLAFNSAQNAADLDALRQALGYDEWNLYGISYGTRLALTAMRDFPAGIRSVILDSSYPPQQDLYATIEPNFERSLQRLFDDCAGSDACNAAYPDLESVFYDTINQLDANPVTVTGTLPSTGENYDILINGNFLTGFVFEALYQSNVLPSLPQMIYAARDDDFALMTIISMALLDQTDMVSVGMQLSVQCSEEVPFSDPDAATQNAAANPLLEKFIVSRLNLGKGIFTVCNNWIHNDAPSVVENEPVVSSIPTLVMAGQYDPITPPEWGREVASTLDHSYFFEYPGTGHGASVSGDCPLQMALNFVDDPTSAPDAACIADMGAPNFAIASETVNLVEFTDDTLRVQGVRPDDWQQIAPGTFGRSAIGEVAISQIALPGMTADTTAGLILSQIPDAVLPEPFATYQASRYEWTIYELDYQGLVIRMSLSEDSDGAYLVMLQAPASEIDHLYDAVLIPALDAFAPLDR